MTPADYKVLLVDDDPTLLLLLSRWLTVAGYSVRTASDGQEALDAVELECPDFLITDWLMPNIDGLKLCQKMREMVLPHYVYIIFLTVQTGANEMIAGLENGADDFLTKPVCEGELLARMKSSARVLELERQLSLMAHTDSLTGLSTQRSFYELLEKEWHRSRRSRAPLSCVMMDLDFFKRVNDVHGHPAGDSVLKFVAELLADCCRASDTVCRYGGEEFCIMLPDTTENDAAVWAERARARLSSLRIPVGLSYLNVTGSFGVAQCRKDTQNWEELVDLADQALLCAKRMGRDRIIRYASLADAAEPNLVGTKQRDTIFADQLARDVMVPLTICPRATDTVEEATRAFLRQGAPAAPVLDDNGALAGFVSEKDLIMAMVSPEGRGQPLSSIMRSNVICYEEDTPASVVYEFLSRVSIRGVVITDRGRPTGMINRGTLLRWFQDWIAGKHAVPPPAVPSSCREDNTTDRASAPIPRSRDSEPAVPAAG
ncbi:MAG: diguanylate cyclase [Pirellulales bacterium]|nr:diguanylate cyclase [Pirellulales bacterium]